jgi:hypothetical protein
MCGQLHIILPEQFINQGNAACGKPMYLEIIIMNSRNSWGERGNIRRL